MNIICVIDKKTNGIGYKNDLLVRLKKDIRYFKKITTEKQNSSSNIKNLVIMGRNTWYSIPKKFRPLNDRNKYYFKQK